MATSPAPEGHAPVHGLHAPVFKNITHHTKSFEILNVMRQQHLLCDVTVHVGNKDVLGKFRKQKT